jgi:uncharacterized cupredoxin-like copper-binding protein
MIDLKAQTLSLAVTAALLSATTAAMADSTVVTAATDPAVIEVMMTNKQDGSQNMILSEHSIHAGPVLFKVMNHSPDSVHEFLVVRTDLDPNAFPMQDGGAKMDESKFQGIKELGDLHPGKSGQMKMTLEPGRYVLFCNEPGHFKGGMAATLTVIQ